MKVAVPPELCLSRLLKFYVETMFVVCCNGRQQGKGFGYLREMPLDIPEMLSSASVFYR